MKSKNPRGRPRTKLPDYPLQAKKMEQVLIYMKQWGKVKIQEDLTPLFGLNSRTAFNKLFLGKKALNQRHKEFFSLKTRIRPDWWETQDVPIELALAGVENSQPRNDMVSLTTTEEGQTATIRWVPKLGKQCQTGNQEHANEIQIDGLTLSYAEQIPVPENLLPKDRDFYALSIEDDSMEPDIKEGSMVFVDSTPRAPEYFLGKTVVAWVPDMGTVVKQFKRSQRKDWLLHSLNPESDDIVIPQGFEGLIVREVVSAYTVVK